MRTESTAIPSPLGITSRARALWLRTATGALVATAINATIWASGRATDVPFTVRSALDDASIRVGIDSVVFATLFAFAAGSALLALSARRSNRSLRIVRAVAALVAATSAAGPLTAAQDTASGVLLAAMHLISPARCFC